LSKLIQFSPESIQIKELPYIANNAPPKSPYNQPSPLQDEAFSFHRKAPFIAYLYQSFNKKKKKKKKKTIKEYKKTTNLLKQPHLLHNPQNSYCLFLS
jgi:hypothetical protein